MKGLAAALLLLGAACLAGCGGHESAPEKKVFVLGDTTFNAENEEYGVDPRRGYSGWAAVRYGAGETLFRYTDDMELSPWLAVSWERPDDCTWRIRLREGVTFADGRPMDGTAVKESLEAVLAAQPAVRDMLGISSIEAEGLTVTIATAEPKPALLQGLSDPRCCIMDVRADVPEGLAVGTGPYQAASVMPGERLELVRNDRYWGGRPKLDRVVVHTLSDGDTLAMALQSGAVDAAYGLPYASYPLFANGGYQFSRCATSRVFFLQFNMEGLPGQDSAVRRAAALCIDRAGFVKALLGGHGYPARGPYPTDFSFADTAAPEGRYAPGEAAEILEAAGWRDTDGDGIREKDGQTAVLRGHHMTNPRPRPRRGEERRPAGAAGAHLSEPSGAASAGGSGAGGDEAGRHRRGDPVHRRPYDGAGGPLAVGHLRERAGDGPHGRSGIFLHGVHAGRLAGEFRPVL